VLYQLSYITAKSGAKLYKINIAAKVTYKYFDLLNWSNGNRTASSFHFGPDYRISSHQKKSSCDSTQYTFG
jgi:hypothetical protein